MKAQKKPIVIDYLPYTGNIGPVLMRVKKFHIP